MKNTRDFNKNSDLFKMKNKQLPTVAQLTA